MTKTTILLPLLILAACGDPTEEDVDAGLPPATYTFASRFDADLSSVSYSGQTARQVLIDDLHTHLGGLTDSIDEQRFTPTDAGDVVGTIDFYFRFDSDSNGDEAISITTEPGLAQTSHADISTGKDLVGKLAGNDAVTDHRDWSTEFSGWSDQGLAANGGSTSTPEGLLGSFFATIEANAVAHADGENRKVGGVALPVTVTTQGQDLQQLTQKFLTGAVAFSQGTDDYLDDDVDGKGLLSPNTRDEDKPYTKLEHAWDEGFGYFGAARDYADYTDEELAIKGGRDDWQGHHDSNGDGAIDLTSEYNFGAANNAAKRDRGSQAGAETDFTKDAFTAFLAGRHLIANAGEALTDAELTALKGYRDQIVVAWEGALAATVVHYINDVLGDMDTFGTAQYEFLAHAKHWSEMKGFALAFQFNPRSPLPATRFQELHAALGDAPTLADADETDVDDYRARLLAARTMPEEAYGFAGANVEGW